MTARTITPGNDPQDGDGEDASARRSMAAYEALVAGDDDAARSIRLLIADAITRDASEICLRAAGAGNEHEVVADLRVLGDMVRHSSYGRVMGEALLLRFRRGGIQSPAAGAVQDGRCDITVPAVGDSPSVRYDMRMTLIPMLCGEMLTIRLLRQQDRQQDRQHLAAMFPTRDSDIAQRIKRSVAYGGGLVIVAGASGTGKSSTLAAILDHVAVPERKTVSIEDPVETLIPGVQQIAANTAHLSFPQALRAVLRADADMIMVSEIRDRETAAEAIRASQTGHTLLASVHARSASHAVTRLVDLGTTRDQLAEELRLVVSQRLVRRLCSRCSADGEPRGCDGCANGYNGRVALAETLAVGDDMRAAMRHPLPSTPMEGRDGYRRFDEHAAALIANNITTQAEVLRVVGAEIAPHLLARGAEAAGGAQ